MKSTKGQSDTLRQKAQAARSKADEAKATQSANSSRSRVLTDLTKLRDQGRLDGFFVGLFFCSDVIWHG